VLTPTRELARQVADVISSLSDTLSTVCVYGGAPIGPQGKYLVVVWHSGSVVLRKKKLLYVELGWYRDG